jgi:hypothetical protein
MTKPEERMIAAITIFSGNLFIANLLGTEKAGQQHRRNVYYEKAYNFILMYFWSKSSFAGCNPQFIGNRGKTTGGKAAGGIRRFFASVPGQLERLSSQ